MAGPYFSKTWAAFVYRETAYTLAHLYEYEFVIEDAAHCQRRIVVTFADHCFTRSPVSGDDPHSPILTAIENQATSVSSATS
jgi:hypothetical protein